MMSGEKHKIQHLILKRKICRKKRRRKLRTNRLQYLRQQLRLQYQPIQGFKADKNSQDDFQSPIEKKR